MKNVKFKQTKRFNTFLKRWVQFRVGAIPRLPRGAYYGYVQIKFSLIKTLVSK